MSNEGGIIFVTLAGTNAEKTLGATAGDTAGAVFTVPAGQRYMVLYGRSCIVCDGNAANRKINVYIDDGTGLVRWVSRKSTAITAGQTGYVSWAAGNTDAGGESVDVCNLSLPFWCILEAGERLVQVANGLAGDSHTARFYVLAMAVKT